MSELKACPFCNASDAEVYPRDRERTIWTICCGNPDCVSRGDMDYDTETEAIAAWNTRAQPAPTADQEKRARELLDAEHPIDAKKAGVNAVLIESAAIRVIARLLAENRAGEAAAVVCSDPKRKGYAVLIHKSLPPGTKLYAAEPEHLSVTRNSEGFILGCTANFAMTESDILAIERLLAVNGCAR